jgi:hypothetical protein
MNRKYLGLVFALFLAMPVFLVSCGDDDDGNGVAPGDPNLQIESITWSQDSPAPNQTYSVTVVVENTGGEDAASSNTSVSVDGEMKCEEIFTALIPAGESLTITCPVGTPTAGSHEIEACADVGDIVQEEDEEDNCSIETLTITDDGVPELPGAGINTDVDFQSQDQNAQQAQGFVQSLLGSATVIAGICGDQLAPLEDAEWGDPVGGCRSWTMTQEGCTATYEVCDVAEGIEWTLTLDGTCGGPGEPPYENWVAWRGTTNQDGTSGTLRWFEPNSETIGGACTWSVSSDRRSGTWTFYEGIIAPENIVAILDKETNQDDSQDLTWTIPESTRWQTHVDAGGTSGWMKFYNWDSDAEDWVLQSEIIWNADGTGSWTTYDDEGNVINELTW